MMRLALSLAGILALFGAPAPCLAQEDVLALIDETLRSNPGIAAQRSAVEGLDARVDAARAPGLPRVDVTGLVERRWTDFDGGAQPDTAFTARQGSIDASWRIFDGFGTRYAVATARAERTSGEAALESRVADTIGDLLLSVAAVRRDRTIRDQLTRQREAIGGRLDQTRSLLDMREATRTDVAQAESRLARAASELETQAGEVRASEDAVVAIAGRLPADLTPPRLPALPPDLESARATALATNPRVLAARADRLAAGKAVGVARAQTWPVVELTGGSTALAGGVPNIFIGRIANSRASSYVGVQLRAPLFQGFADEAALRRARALLAERTSIETATERQVLLELQAAWARAAASAAALDRAEAAVAAGREASALMSRELAARNRTVIDALDAESDVLLAEVRAERVRFDRLAAEVAVLRAMGALKPAAFAPSR